MQNQKLLRGGHLVAEQADPLPEVGASHVGTRVQVAATPLLIQLSAGVPGQAVAYGSSTCCTCEKARESS